MKLLVTTPTAVVVDVEGTTDIRAEDSTGLFGVRPGHADLLTVLVPSVITWRDGGGEHHVAVRGGIFTVEDGRQVRVATRQAASEDEWARLGPELMTRFREEAAAEDQAARAAARLQLAAIRRLQEYLGASRGAPVSGSVRSAPEA